MRRLVFPMVALFLLSGCATGPLGHDDRGCGTQCVVAAPTTPPAQSATAQTGPPQTAPPQTAPRPTFPGQTAGAQPAPIGACVSGLRVELGDREAAMGLRVHGIALVNCGTESYAVQGYPRLELAGDDGLKLDVQILDGLQEISASLSSDVPQQVTLGPGERAHAVLAWRGTYDDISRPPVSVTYVRVTPQDGRPAQELTPVGGLDLGSTGRLGVSPWFEDPQAAASGL